MDCEGQLEAGQQLSLRLPRGAELYCAGGTLRLVPHFSTIGLAVPAQTLRAGQGWRAGETTQLTVLAQTAAHYRLVGPAAQKQKPRQAGLWVQRLLAALRRGRRAA